MKFIRIDRILECIPGIFVWGTFVTALVLSYMQPLWAIFFIIVFDTYWFLRVIYLLIYMLTSWRRYRQTSSVDWWPNLKNSNSRWSEYVHVIFLPVYNEPHEIIHETIKVLSQARYDHKKMIIVLTGEERGGAQKFLESAAQLKQEYTQVFYDFLFCLHPQNLDDEIPGKGSNLNYAGHFFKQYADTKKIDYEKIIVSCFDIDTRVHPSYFAYLTHRFINHPNPYRTSFQPIAVYNNNMWESNAIIRVVASSTTFWLLTDLARPERLFTFSSHSMSFRALVEVGFWDKRIVTEDSRIFLQCFVYYHGEYRVEPLYLPVYMNTADVGNLKRTLVNQYRQIRRWAWGVEHFPWMMRQFFFSPAGKNISFYKKIRYLWNQLEGVYSWATAPLLMYILGHLPLWFAKSVHVNTAFFQNTPLVLSYLMRGSMIGILAISIMYYLLLPPRPPSVHPIHNLFVFLQWLLVPVTIIIFGSIPAIDAQTRLMLGGKFRLGFTVTEKKPRRDLAKDAILSLNSKSQQ